VTTSTVFRIGSISKVFTALAVMQLRDNGKLDLDDPVQDYLPWFTVQQTDPDSPPISVRHLLTHTSGLPGNAPGVSYTTHTGPSRAELIKNLPDVATLYAAGSRSSYSNFGFAILGELVEAISGRPFTEYVEQHILDPLGMSSTDLEPDPSMPGLATGYFSRIPGQVRRPVPFAKNFNTPSGDGAASLQDMVSFVSFLMTESAESRGRVLSLAALRDMRRPHWVNDDWNGGRGLALGIRRRDGRTLVRASGDSPGFLVAFEMDVAQQLGVIVLANAYDGDVERYVEQAFLMVGRALRQQPMTTVTASAVPESWRMYEGIYESAGPWWGPYHVMILSDGLAGLDVSEDDPWATRSRLEPTRAPHVFAVIRPDGIKHGLSTFRLDASGKVVGLTGLEEELRRTR
jgi:CubicO group peptidase (beta-lactamase class C family)